MNDESTRDWSLYPGGPCDPTQQEDAAWPAAVAGRSIRASAGEDGPLTCWGALNEQLKRSEPDSSGGDDGNAIAEIRALG